PSRIMRIFDDGRVQIEIEADGTLKYSSREELLHLYSQNRLQFSGGDCDTEGKFGLTRTERPLHSFPDSVQNGAIRRKRYLDLIRSYGSFNSSPTVLGPLIEECAKQIQDPNPPSRISVWRWHKKFVRSEFDHRAVIDRHDLKGGRGSRLHPVVQEALQEVIDEIYLNNERNSGEAVYSALRYRIDKKNEFLAPTQRFNIPSKSTIYRTIASLDKYDTASARLGPRIAQMKFRTSGM